MSRRDGCFNFGAACANDSNSIADGGRLLIVDREGDPDSNCVMSRMGDGSCDMDNNKEASDSTTISYKRGEAVHAEYPYPWQFVQMPVVKCRGNWHFRERIHTHIENIKHV